jgi:hypothetical protein
MKFDRMTAMERTRKTAVGPKRLYAHVPERTLSPQSLSRVVLGAKRQPHAAVRLVEHSVPVANCFLLLDRPVSGQTVYHWEQGKARPRAAQLESLAMVRGLGAREIAERLSRESH